MQKRTTEALTLPRGHAIATAGLAVLLAVFIGLLLLENYRGHVAQRDRAIRDHQREAAGRASALSYYFSERKHDLADLARHQAVVGYLQRRALGMPVERGLSANAFDLDEQLRRLLDETGPLRHWFYDRIVLMDQNGRVIADGSHPTKRHPCTLDWPRLLDAASSEPVILMAGAVTGACEHVLVSTPCFLDDAHAGQLLAFIDTQSLYGQLAADDPQTGEDVRIGRAETTLARIQDPAATSWGWTGLAGQAIALDQPVTLWTMDTSGRRVRVVVSQAQITGTPLSVVQVAELDELFSGLAPWKMLLGLAALATAVLCGGVLVMRSRTRNLLLAARLGEHSVRQREMRRKNKELAREIRIRKRMEADLRVSEERFRSFADSLPQTVFETNVIGELSFVNDQAFRMFGYSREDVAGGMSALDVFPPEDRLRARTDLARLLLGHEGYEIAREYTVMRTDGTRFPVLIHATPIIRGGRARGICGIVIDISERSRAEEALRHAKDVAEGAARTKSEFLANMSHEVRTPLNGVIGMADMLLTTELTREQRDYIGVIQRSGDVLMAIVNDVLDFSKIEAGKLEISSVSFHLREWLDETLQAIDLRAHQKGLGLTAHVSPDTPDHLEGDPGRLRQILVNLLANAIKFTPEGEVSVGVETEGRAGNEVRLRFAVRDTGVGIPPERQASIFTAFEQADGATTRQYGGTGLGLAISKRLAELMRGCIWVESEVGKGSTFYFTARLEASEESSQMGGAAAA